jgi:hypothetical protein
MFTVSQIQTTFKGILVSSLLTNYLNPRHLGPIVY